MTGSTAPPTETVTTEASRAEFTIATEKEVDFDGTAPLGCVDHAG